MSIRALTLAGGEIAFKPSQDIIIRGRELTAGKVPCYSYFLKGWLYSSQKPWSCE